MFALLFDRFAKVDGVVGSHRLVPFDFVWQYNTVYQISQPLLAMKRVPVQSSSVLELGYDRDTMTLEVAFRKGDVYRYFDVPQALYHELIRSDSLGKFLNAYIKDRYSIH
jgi:hypothetical protein